MRKGLLLITLAISLSNAYSQQVFLIGDAGEPDFPEDFTLNYLRQQLQTASKEDILIFLGDNLYPVGLPAREDLLREEMEKKLNASLDIMKSFAGRAYMIPGNHDWANGKKSGWDQIQNMQEYVDSYLGYEGAFIPKGGCPGPVEVEVSPEILLVIIDTQYLLHPWDKPDETSGCDAKSSTDALVLLDDILARNTDRHVVIAGHHPMYSYGPHGSKYTFRQHVFPLTDVNRNLWIPLPIIGSIYPTFRSLFGSLQDIPNPRYKVIRNATVDLFKQVPNLVYVDGHEHSLQYIQLEDVHYVVSGAGSKSSNVTKGKGTRFYRETHGFAKLDYNPSGEVSLAFFDGDKQEKIYDEVIYQKEVQRASQEEFDVDYKDSTVTVPISTRYEGANKTREYWLGKNYREIWATPVELSVFNIGREKGGLKIIKLGGGNQTKSLRLEAENGRQYVLRSLDKFTEKLLPSALYETLIADIIQDQISAANPYGAFAIPPLAEAAGIYHTNPKLVYIPNDPRFGEYQNIFSEMVVLYEERPNDEAAHEAFFGSGEDIKGTPDVIDELHEDNDEAVDQPFALRSRLFDMIIGDWDRHEDQWRWVAVDKEPKGHLWRPIPRDRDQAFFVNEGMFGWAASRKFALPNTEGFDEEVDWAPGFNASARFFDRTFLNGLDWKDWEEQITVLQKELTDEVIRNAFNVWPDTVEKQAADETAKVVAARRDDLPRYAREHYLFISKDVEIVGSDKHEYFLVERLNDDQTKVTVWKRKKDGEIEQVLYQRTFERSVTNEIRLYGLEGEDLFEIKGDVDKGIRVRIIGGEDKDEIRDLSKVSGLKRHTLVYDRRSTDLSPSPETKSKLSDKPGINFYNRTAFEYDKLLPLISVEFNPDDGLFLGGGFIFTKEGWRKDPFKYQHNLQANVALLTGAFKAKYEGTYSDVIGKLDLNGQFQVQRPFGASNYFGLGNESSFDHKGVGIASGYEDEIDFYRIRFDQDRAYINLTYNLGTKGLFRFGPEYFGYHLEEDTKGKFINIDPNIAPEVLTETFNFVGVRAELAADTRDHAQLPTRGIYAGLNYTKYYGLSEAAQGFTKLNGEFRFLLSTRIPSKLTLANRIGAEHNIGDIEFFNGAILGKETLRGYRRTRFVGNTSFYHNVDLRLQLFSFRSYLFPAGVGLIGFHDIGRVWLEGEESDEWHASKGFGIWLAPLNQVVATFNLAFSEDETLPTVTFGYQF